ncbi:AAA family ATPase [Fuerstiella marisgermanici]|uniref:Transcriptional regulator HilA n=1 Tax=Fuerstiella marisgermanici TaxID=1891926 RepID=A0A1P8WRA5_9PLAN|nr:AAA family ATPase [Fuerstiella marisgermanici]APZ96601.1 Transcriptional regulator HilA [Fuerstiella marisgermanici]
MIQFEDFRLDVEDAQLLRGGKRVALTPKAFDVLARLATNAGRLISKEELLNSLWDDALVSDASLVVCIREIRKRLGDNARSPQFIETVHRRGYRFIADVNEAGGAEVKQDQAPRAETSARASGERQPGDSTSRHATTRTRVSSIVGRQEEFAELDRVFRVAASGQRQTVFVAGEPGAGKTAFITDFIVQHTDESVRIAEGQCFEQFGEGEPYLPVLEALTQLTQQSDGDRIIEAITRFAPTWLTQMPSLRGRLPADVAESDALGSSATRMLREMAETLETLTIETPLILIFEDLHWSDYSTLDLISYMARRRQPAKLLIIGTYRPVEIILRNHALKPVKRELLSKQACCEIPLASISVEAVSEYLTKRFPEIETSNEIAARIHRRTDGHPLFVAELISYLAAHDKLIPTTTDVADAPLPENIRAMIDTQIDLVDDEQRKILEAGSIAGVEFSAAAIADVLGQQVLDIEDQLDSLAERQQLLQPVDDGHSVEAPSARYRFRHVLYQEALYKRCAAGRRIRLHRRLGERLEQRHVEPPPELAAQLAIHFERGHVLDRAIHFLRMAADRATRHYANREAAEYVSRAIDLIRRDPSLADLRLSLFEQRGLIYRSSANIAAAAKDFEAMAQEARRRGKVAEQANAQFCLASVFSWVDRQKCLDAAVRANQLAERLDSGLHQKHLRGWWAYWNLLWEGWTEGDAAASSAAISAARKLNDREMLCLHLSRSGCFHLVLSDYDTACRATEEAMQLATEIGDASEYLLATFFRGWACLYDGRWEEMARLLWDGLQIAETNGHDRYALLLRLQMAQLCNEAGDFDHAAELAERSLKESRELDLGYGQLVSPILLGVAYLGQDRAGEALELLEQIVQRLDNERLLMDWIWKMPLRYATARCHFKLGNLDAVRDYAAKLRLAASFPRGQTHEALSHQLLADASLRQGDSKAARAEITRALNIVQTTRLPLAEWRILQTAATAFADSDPERSQECELQSQNAFSGLVQGLNATFPSLRPPGNRSIER